MIQHRWPNRVDQDKSTKEAWVTVVMLNRVAIMGVIEEK